MKVSCSSCGAKYNISDDKVRGRLVKIACKKCNSRIEVDGRSLPETSTISSVVPKWSISLNDDETREVTEEELASLFRSNAIQAESLVWQEGMPDWQPLRNVEALRHLIGLVDEPSHSAPTPSKQVAEAAYEAARLDDERRRSHTDLFAPHSDEERHPRSVPTPIANVAAMPSSAPQSSEGKPIGARNENSVLFSLNALTSSGNAPKSTNEEKSGLIDIQKLAASADTSRKDESKTKLDDIMNLSSGGAFGSPLASPILAAPPLAAVAAAPAESEKKKSGALLWVLIGMLAAAAIGAVLFFVVLKKPSSNGATPVSTATITTPTIASAPTTPMVAEPNTTSTPVVATADPTTTSSSSAKPNAPTTPNAAGANTTKATTPAAPGVPAAPATTPEPAPASPTPAPTTAPTTKPTEECKTLDCILAKQGGGAAPAGPEFNRNAAISALSGVSYSDCGSGGKGSVQITFNPDGSVAGVSVSGDYDPTTKNCIAGRFRGAKVPPFSGPLKSVSRKIFL